MIGATISSIKSPYFSLSFHLGALFNFYRGSYLLLQSHQVRKQVANFGGAWKDENSNLK